MSSLLKIRQRLSQIGAVLTLVALTFTAGSCFTSSDGLQPEQRGLYFPTAVVISPGGNALYVANSDFDLQFNGGTVQVLDLNAIREITSAISDGVSTNTDVNQACKNAAGLARNDSPLLHPGPCSALSVDSFVRGSATIGAFASGAVLMHRLDGPGARLFVPVRGDPSVTYFDVTDDRDPTALSSSCGDTAFCLQCGQASSDAAETENNRCAPEFRVGENPYLNLRGVVMPAEPIGIDGVALPAGDALVVAHQTEQAASLVVNDWNSRPTLEYFIRNLEVGPTEVAALPMPGFARASGDELVYRPGFLVTFRESAEVTLLRYEDDKRSSPDRPFLTRAGGVTINTNSTGDDSRGIAIDDSERAACEADCAEDDLTCLRACLSIPMGLFVANRSPASLVVGEIVTELVENEGELVSAFETIRLVDSVPLTFGASRVEIGKVVDQNGELSVRVFAVTFDARFVFSYDPVARRIDAIFRTGRGPHDIAFDTSALGAEQPFSYLYVGHFTDSYIGVIDLDMRRPTFGTMVLTLGPPVPPRDAQ